MSVSSDNSQIVPLQELCAYRLMEDASKCMYHAGTVLDGHNDSIIAAAFGGTYEGHADTAIYLNVLNGSDGSFRQRHKIKVCDKAHWNPVLHRLDDNTIALIFKVGNIIASWQSYKCISHDEGLSWSQPHELVPGDTGGRGPVRNKIIRLKSGRLLCPASSEDGAWRAFVDRSDDNLRTFVKSNDIYAKAGLSLHSNLAKNYSHIAVSSQSFAGQGLIQPSLWQDESGVHMLLRSSYGRVFRSDSTDDGISFCKAYPLDMPNNNSALDLDVKDGNIFLVCNAIDKNFGARTPLSLFISQDGLSFKKLLDLETKSECEFSYPCVRVVANTYLWVSYTYKRENIILKVFHFI